MNPCPFCGFHSVEITTMEQRVPRYLCTGPQCHAWRPGDGPEPVKEQAQEKPGLLKRIASIF